MKHIGEENRVGDFPKVSERDWEVYSIVSAMFTLTAFSATFLFLIVDGINANDLKVVQTLSPFGVGLFALVTYCTVNWRGKITTRQADLAARQIALAERESRAKLLQEGAKLLAEREKDAHVSAGIATLAILVSGDDEPLAVQAMNLIADYVQREMRRTHEHSQKNEAFAALKAGAVLGRRADRLVFFECSEQDKDPYPWSLLSGVRHVSYSGGVIFEQSALGTPFPSKGVVFRNVTLVGFRDVQVSANTRRCTFRRCTIAEVSTVYEGVGPAQPKFSQCDFSGAIIADDFPLEILKNTNCTFEPDRPPQVTYPGRIVDWSQFLRSDPFATVKIFV